MFNRDEPPNEVQTPVKPCEVAAVSENQYAVDYLDALAVLGGWTN